MLIRVGYRSVLIVALVRYQLSIFCLSVVHMIPRDKIFDYLKQVLSSGCVLSFFRSSTFDKAVFCLGEKQDILVKDECSSWFNRVGDCSVVSMEQEKASFI